VKQVPLDETTRHHIITALGNSPLFACLTEDALARLPDQGTVWSVEEGDELTRVGEPSEWFTLIVHGEAVVSITDIDYVTEPELAVLREPATFGEIGLLLGKARTANVRARSPMTLCRFDHAAFDRFLDEIPGFGRRLATKIAERLEAVSWIVPES
jgi:CRP-like cAMP-binding protein